MDSAIWEYYILMGNALWFDVAGTIRSICRSRFGVYKMLPARRTPYVSAIRISRGAT
jgi:hypothetical protein